MSPSPLPPNARERLASLLATRDGELDLGEAALLIAAAGRPDIDPAPVRAELDRLGARFRARLPATPDDLISLRALRDLLAEEGFRLATREERRDGKLLLLDEVLRHRVVLPLMLAVVELEAARCAGFRVDPVDVGRNLFLAARGGLVLDVESGLIGSRAELAPTTDHAGQIQAAEQTVVGRRLIVRRLLRAVQRRRLAEREWTGALGIVELYDVLTPGHPEYHRDRGLLLGRMGAYSDATAELVTYLDARPTARDADSVRRVLAIFKGTRN